MLKNFWLRSKASWKTFRDWESPEAQRARYLARLRERDDKVRVILENVDRDHRDRILHFLHGLSETSMAPSFEIKAFLGAVDGLPGTEHKVSVLKYAVSKCNALVVSPAFQSWVVKNSAIMAEFAKSRRAAA